MRVERVTQAMNSNYTSSLSSLLGMLCLCGCATMSNVDKGLYTTANTLAARDRVTGDRTFNLTDRPHQISQANAVTERMIAELKTNGAKCDEELDAAAYARLNQVFARVHSVSHMRAEKWEVLLIPLPGFNAFVNGGTYAVVHYDLLKDVTDDELAAVLGHEMGHVAANHVFEMQTHLAVSTLAQSGAARSSTFQAAFTYENEKEADQIGILYAALAGYDPFAASHIWARMFRQGGNSRDYVNSHPVNSEREAQTRAIGTKVYSYYTQGQRNPDFERILTSNTLWNAETKEVEAGKGGGFLAVISAAADAYSKHMQARTEEAVQISHMRTLETVRQNMTLVSQKIVDNHTYQVGIQYRGFTTLKRVMVAMVVQRGGTDPIRFVQNIYQTIGPGGTFSVSFSDAKLDLSNLRRGQVAIIIDDAEF